MANGGGAEGKKTFVDTTIGYVTWERLAIGLLSIVVAIVGSWVINVSNKIDSIAATQATQNIALAGVQKDVGDIKDGQRAVWDQMKAINTAIDSNNSRLSTVEEWQRIRDQEKINQLEETNKANNLARSHDWSSFKRQMKAEEKAAGNGDPPALDP